MAAQSTRLKFLLYQRRWQTHRAFCTEYDKAARAIDKSLVGSWPSRTQLHRWMSGALKELPYPDHCRVLEQMLPGWRAEQLFEACSSEQAAVLVEQDRSGSSASEIVKLFEAIDSGLESPDASHAEWTGGPRRPADAAVGSGGAQPWPVHPGGQDAVGVTDTGRELGSRLLALSRELGLSAEETRQLAGLAGNVVDLDLRIDIEIDPEGWATVTYSSELLNLSDRPFTRAVRELWFETTRSPLTITPIVDGKPRVVIQRIHDTPSMAKFACQLSPAVRPGELGTLCYQAEGGRFIQDHYWRHALHRYTRHLTLKLRHCGGQQLVGATATEEHPDGAEHSATEDLIWDVDDQDVVITLTRGYLRPGQAVTLRWEVSRDDS
jgi:hypothetical protein